MGKNREKPPKKTSEAKFLELFEDLRDFGLSVNSFREAFKAKAWFWRIIWAGAGLIALGFCLSEIGNLCDRLIQQPTATKNEFVVNETLTFPVVSICTYARVNMTQIKSMNISDDLLSYMLSAFKGLYLFYNEGGNQRHLLGQLDSEYQRFLDSQQLDFSLYQFFIKHGTHCKKFLSACMFQGDDFECCDESHMKEVLTDVGKCFVIKPPTVGQTIPGAIGGLKIYISNWGETYPETSKTMLYFANFLSRGIIFNPYGTKFVVFGHNVTFCWRFMRYACENHCRGTRKVSQTP